MTDRKKPHGRGVAILLIVCIAIVAFWEIMANRSRRPFEPFDLTSADFKKFFPSSDEWSIRSRPVNFSPTEPNILALELSSNTPTLQHSNTPLLPYSHTTVLVRLVHGYNMPDCMRIKGYEVELVADTRGQGGGRRTSNPEHPTSNIEGQRSGETERHSATRHLPLATPNLQVWRLTSATGDVAIWVTAMLRAGDLEKTDVDVRSMAFPRIGVPIDPNWAPRGLTLKSLRHPIRNFRRMIQSKWNGSRCDLAVFLRLKQPAWASEESLTLVASSDDIRIQPEHEEGAVERVVAAHTFVHAALKAWQGERGMVSDER